MSKRRFARTQRLRRRPEKRLHRDVTAAAPIAPIAHHRLDSNVPPSTDDVIVVAVATTRSDVIAGGGGGGGVQVAAYLVVDLRLELDEAGSGHPDARPAAGDLEEAEDDVPFVPRLDEVLRLEEQRVPYAQRPSAPRQEVRDVDAAVEGSRLRAAAVLDRRWTGTGCDVGGGGSGIRFLAAAAAADFHSIVEGVGVLAEQHTCRQVRQEVRFLDAEVVECAEPLCQVFPHRHQELILRLERLDGFQWDVTTDRRSRILIRFDRRRIRSLIGIAFHGVAFLHDRISIIDCSL